MLDAPSESEKHPETGARRIARDMHTAATRVIGMEWDCEFKESFKESNPPREVGEDGSEPSYEDRSEYRKQAVQAEAVSYTHLTLPTILLV